MLIQEAIKHARKEPVWFRKHVLNLNNDPWEDEILEAFADLWRLEVGIKTKVNHDGLNRFSVRSGTGPGKTFVAAELMHYCAFTRECQIPCTATKEKQVLTRLWPRFRQIYNGAIPE